MFGQVYRALKDSASGTLSSDGRFVFSLENAANVTANRSLGVGDNALSGRRLHGRLAAYDLPALGKLKWRIGGGLGSNAVRPDMVFLGPPLPLGGQLFVLVEMNGEIHLLALEAESGGLLWSQVLARVDQEIPDETDRRLFGISPSYSDGILVCPTNCGGVVSIDLSTQSLLWGCRYGCRKGDLEISGAALGAGVAIRHAPRIAVRWLDATAAIADGRMVITPVETESIYCLNLANGTLAWAPLPKQNDLYVANVYCGKIVLVGRHAVHAIRLADGRPAWDGRTVAFPAGAMPSGRGYASGNRYYVPLSNAEVVAVDLDDGTIAQVFKSREGFIPGNLVCHRGKVISQGWDAVEVFRQTDALREEIARRLKANPDDAEALRLLGESRLDEGNLAEAVPNLRRAYHLELEPKISRSRDLLRETLLEGLRCDFATFGGQAEEIERLLDDAGQRIRYSRLMVEGLRKTEQWRAAFDHYMRLMDMEGGDRVLEVAGPSWSARRDRWIWGGLRSLCDKAPDKGAGGDQSRHRGSLGCRYQKQVTRRTTELRGPLRRS